MSLRRNGTTSDATGGARRYGRPLIVALVLFCIIVIPVASLPFLISTENVRNRILHEAAAITGREISFRDPPRITLSPFLGIEITNVIFRDPHAREEDPPLLHMERLRGRLEILPALLGRVSISQYQFVRPRFNLRVYGDGKVSWAFPEGQVWNLLQRAREVRANTPTGAKPDFSTIGTASIGRFEIVDGTIGYENRVTGRQDSVTNLNGTVDWANSRVPASLSGSGIWRGEAFRLAGRLDTPLAFLSGGNSPIDIDLSSSAIAFAFKGEANMLADIQLRGTAKLSTPSLRRVMELAGNPLDTGSTLAGFAASGNLEATQKALNFTESDFAMDGNRGRGSLQIALAGRDRPRISGTLAFANLDIGPYIAALRQDMEMGRNAIDRLKLADRLELDLRVSAEKALIGKLPVTQLAAAISMKPEELLLDVGNAMAFGGSTIGTLLVRRGADGPSVEGRALLGGVAGEQLSASFFPGAAIKLGGSGDVEISLKTKGATDAEIADNATGKARLNFVNGVLGGVDLAQLKSLVPGGDGGDVPLSGQTAYRRLSAELDLIRKLVLVRNLQLASSRISASMTGKLAWANGGIAMRLVLGAGEPGQNATAARPEPEAVLFIGGSAGSPLVTRSYGNSATTTTGTARARPDPGD